MLAVNKQTEMLNESTLVLPTKGNSSQLDVNRDTFAVKESHVA